MEYVYINNLDLHRMSLSVLVLSLIRGNNKYPYLLSLGPRRPGAAKQEDKHVNIEHKKINMST